MANTRRDKLNARRRAKRRAWTVEDFLSRLPGDHADFDYSDPLNRYPRLRGGNMVMAPSASGIWDDERPISGKGRDRDQQRRQQKRRERQAWRKDALDILADEQ